jgi:hypothetical protein
MYPDERVDELIDRLKRAIGAGIICICIIIITVCCVYMYIVRPINDKQKSTIKIGYEKFKSFSMPIGDVTGTEDYDDATVATYTDDWGIRYEVKERTK